MREPAGQHAPDQTEELPIGADPDRCLRDRERDQFRVTDQRSTTAAPRDRVLVSEDVGCNDKGFQIRHLELRSRGDTGLEALLRQQTAGPCRNPPFRIKPLARQRFRRRWFSRKSASIPVPRKVSTASDGVFTIGWPLTLKLVLSKSSRPVSRPTA